MLSALYAIARPSVRPSVTRVDQSKTVERIIEILSPSNRPNILVSRSQCSLKANISQTVHLIHSMIAPRLGFSGSADRMVLFAVR